MYYTTKMIKVPAISDTVLYAFSCIILYSETITYEVQGGFPRKVLVNTAS